MASAVPVPARSQVPHARTSTCDPLESAPVRAILLILPTAVDIRPDRTCTTTAQHETPTRAYAARHAVSQVASRTHSTPAAHTWARRLHTPDHSCYSCIQLYCVHTVEIYTELVRSLYCTVRACTRTPVRSGQHATDDRMDDGVMAPYTWFRGKKSSILPQRPDHWG